jgi:SAM-dependent methyltransferase
LPFSSAIFDVVTASFLLSHLRDYGAGLVEAHRVLKPSGIFVMTSWGASTDPYSQAWSGLLAEAVSKERLQEAIAQVAPSEAHFENAENVQKALTAAGLVPVEVHVFALECSLSLERYLADRELSSGGRFAQDALGPDRWGRFLADAREKLQGAFGSFFDYTRGVLVGVARRA